MSDDANVFVSLPEDELDLLIGEAILGDTFGSKPQSAEEIRTIARNWFNANLRRFANAVCDSNGPIQKLLGKEQKDRNLIIAEVLDTVLKGAGVPVPAAVLAAKILHYGIDRLCRECS